jgi:hypothetical protein
VWKELGHPILPVPTIPTTGQKKLVPVGEKNFRGGRELSKRGRPFVALNNVFLCTIFFWVGSTAQLLLWHWFRIIAHGLSWSCYSWRTTRETTLALGVSFLPFVYLSMHPWMSLGLTPKKTAHLRAMEPKERAKRKWGRQ